MIRSSLMDKHNELPEYPDLQYVQVNGNDLLSYAQPENYYDDYEVDEPQITGDGSTYLSDNQIEDALETWLDQINEGNVEPQQNEDLSEKLNMKRAFNFPSRKKKNQMLCRVHKTIHHHNEAGYDFFPKSYTSYTCNPVTTSSPMEVPLLINSHDMCYVLGNKCITTEKEQLFLKRHRNSNCWSHFVASVGAGCRCLSKTF